MSSSPTQHGGAADHDGDHAAITVAAGSVLQDAQDAMRGLLAGAGLAGARPAEVARTLGLDKTLAWKLARFIDDDAPEAARHMPGAGGVEIVLRAADTNGVAGPRIAAARDADARLRDFVSRHAGDRRTFEAILAGAARDESLMLEERRAFYRAGSAIWGVRAKTQFVLLVIRPSPDQPGALDALQLSGFIDLERLRPDIPWIVRRLRASDDTGKRMYQIPRVPLDPAGVTEGGFPLIPAHCSEPPPEITQTEAANGWIYDELVPGALGRSGAATIVSGETMPAALPAERSDDNTFGRYMLTIRTPLEGAQFDLLLHRSLTHFGAPEASIVGLVEDRATPQAHDGMHIITPTPAADLGEPTALRSRRIAGYDRMAADALARAGWDTPDAFRGYRFETDYPPAPCEINMISAIHAR